MSEVGSSNADFQNGFFRNLLLMSEYHRLYFWLNTVSAQTKAVFHQRKPNGREFLIFSNYTILELEICRHLRKTELLCANFVFIVKQFENFSFFSNVKSRGHFLQKFETATNARLKICNKLPKPQKISLKTAKYFSGKLPLFF